MTEPKVVRVSKKAWLAQTYTNPKRQHILEKGMEFSSSFNLKIKQLLISLEFSPNRKSLEIKNSDSQRMA